MTIRVVVVDDQHAVREGLVLIVDARDDLSVVGEAADGHAAVAVAEEKRPDVVLMDVRMDGMDGIEATRRIVASGNPAKVVMLTTFDLDEHVYAALQAGASGFMLKSMRPTEIADGIRAVARGDAMLAPPVTRRLLDRFAGQAAAPPALAGALGQLSAREQEVLTLVARGRSNTEIAETLFLSLGTVKTHVSAILTKLGLRDRLQAAVFAYESGLVRPGAPS
ncbi:response regulator transcription factor [Asanoa sp. WMMD1127]|uniref:response regulator n=1 Tax=Asanoa sp. WMMD1127 TaxID=3016107 RepID=UPI00241655BD|nr:response regulator transcription factor [Asanoa sp. WMMD1127]MDG4824699.1 response regulator transcription factor [Asanoa sp. WMMD1127]